MVNDSKIFTKLKRIFIPISQADGTFIYAEGIGDIGPLKDILYVPKLKYNLISISYFNKLGFRVIFDFDGSVIIKDKNKNELKIGNRSDKLYYSNDNIFNIDKIDPNYHTLTVKESNKFSLWHRRFCHINAYYIHKAIKHKLITGIDTLWINYNYHCNACRLTKATSSPINTNNIQTPINNSSSSIPTPITNSRSILYNEQLLRYIPNITLVKFAVDLKGPLPPSIHRNTYCIMFTSCISRHRDAFYIKQKSDTVDIFKQFILKIQRFQISAAFQFKNNYPETYNYILEQKYPMEFKSDNGSEFVNHDIAELFLNNNIYHERSAPYAPFQNGIAERSNRTVFDLASALITDSNSPLYLWEYAVSTVIHTLNLLPNKALNLESTPFIELYHRPADVSHLRIYGCTAYVLLQDHQRPNIGVKALKGIFVGYDEGSLSYLVYANHTIHKSRDVVFYESHIYNNPIQNTIHEQTIKLFDTNYSIDNTIDNTRILNELFDHTTTIINNINNHNSNNNSTHTQPISDISDNNMIIDNDDNRYNLRPNRKKTNFLERAITAIISGKFFITPHDHISESVFATIINENDINPDDPNWITAKSTELSRLIPLNTWVIVDSIPVGRKALKFKWVLSKKFDIFKNIDICKARLTVKGCSQIPGIDFEETFSPVAKVTAIRLLLALSAGFGYVTHQFDVQNAFPNATLNDIELYMHPPPELNLPPGKFLKLMRALYGLKQASREWFLLLISVFGKLGFKTCKSESCIVYLIKDNIIIIVGIYVDDMLVASNHINHVKWLYTQLKTYFIVIQKELSKIVGFNIKYDPIHRYMSIDKNDYADKVINDYKHLINNMSAQYTPIDDKVNLSKPTTPMTPNSFPYRPLIGCFNYLSCTLRAELSFSTNYLARFMENYNDTHILQIKKLLRYLHDNPHASIHYCDLNTHHKYFIINGKQYRMLPNQLYVFVDADWASINLDTRRSTSGFLIFFNGGIISWKSCQQKRTAGSSTEAEYIALYEAIKEVIWIKHILEELNLFNTKPVIIYEDNTSTIKASQNPVEHSKLKHLDINYHSIRDYVHSQEVIMQSINSNDQLADLLTKGQNATRQLTISSRFLHFVKANSFQIIN